MPANAMAHYIALRVGRERTHLRQAFVPPYCKSHGVGSRYEAHLRRAD